MWVQDSFKKGISKGSNMIQGKSKSLYVTLKQKECEESKAGEVNANKGWFDNFRKMFGLENHQDNKRSSFCWPRDSRQFPDANKKISEEKEYLLVRLLMQTEVLYFGKRCHKGCLLVK